MKKRILSLLLAAIMVFSILPMSALADWVEGERYDPALVAEIQKICDKHNAEDDDQTNDYTAQQVLDALRTAGVIDRRGKLRLQNSKFTVQEGDSEVSMTKEELVEAAKEKDDTAQVTVDGTPMTWGDVKKLINMMDALIAIQDCLESDQTLTEEHIANIQSFYEALRSGTLHFGSQNSGDPSKRIYLRKDSANQWQFCTVKDGALVADGIGTATAAQETVLALPMWVGDNAAGSYQNKYAYGKSYTAEEMGVLVTGALIQDALCTAMSDGYTYYALDLDVEAVATLQTEPGITLENTYEADYSTDWVTDVSGYKLAGAQVDCITQNVIGSKATKGTTPSGVSFSGSFVQSISVPTSAIRDKYNITGNSTDKKAYTVTFRVPAFDTNVNNGNNINIPVNIKLTGSTIEAANVAFPSFVPGGSDNRSFSVQLSDAQLSQYGDLTFTFGDVVIPGYNWKTDHSSTHTLSGIIPCTGSRSEIQYNNGNSVFDTRESTYDDDKNYIYFPSNLVDFNGSTGQLIAICSTGALQYKVQSITADTGEFLSGEKVRLYVTLDDYLRGDHLEYMKIQVNGQTLTAKNTGGTGSNYTKTVIYEYTVKDDDAAYPVVQKMWFDSTMSGCPEVTHTVCGAKDVPGVSLDSSLDEFKDVVMDGTKGYHVKGDGEGNLTSFCTPLRTDVLKSYTLETDADTGAVSELRFPISASDKNVLRWVCIDTEIPGTGDPYLKTMYAKIDGSDTKLPVKVKLKTGTFEYETQSGATVNVNEVPEYLYVELPGGASAISEMQVVHLYVNIGFSDEDFYAGDESLDEATVYERDAYFPIIQKPISPVTADDLTIVYNDGWQHWSDAYHTDIATEYDQTIRALRLDEYNTGTTATVYPLKLSYAIAPGTFTYVKANNFVWKSSDKSIATVTTTTESYEFGGKDVQRTVATVEPKTYGTVTFTLYALNGASPDSIDENTVKVDSASLTITDAQNPYLIVPDAVKTISTNVNTDVAVAFNTNIPRRNSEQYLQPETEITLRLYEYDAGAEGHKGTEITGDGLPITVKATYDEPVYSITVPGKYITKISPATGISYVAEISAECWETPEARKSGVKKVYSDTAELFVKEGAISVAFDNTGNAVTDDQPYTLGWTWSGVNTKSGNAHWYYEVVDTATGKVLMSNKNTLDSNTFSTTSIMIPQETLKVTGNVLKNTYAVTVYAANDPNAGYSAQSVLLYVYNTAAIDILVKDTAKLNEAVSSVDTGEAGTVKLDHRKFIEDHLAEDGKTLNLGNYNLSVSELQNDLQLAAVVSLKFGDYVWGLVSDQIAWKAEDAGNVKDAADMYLYKGGLYTDIENFTYPSYLPVEEFLLSAAKDGEAKITAKHVASGITKTVDVTINDVKDELFLFQFYPLTEVTATYENGKGETVTVKSDNEGQLALYEPADFKAGTEMYFSAEKNGVHYLGFINTDDIESGEKNVVYGSGKYPVTTVILKASGQASIYLLKPDGSPLANTAVTVRGGAYMNGAYCAAADLYTVPNLTGDPNNNPARSNGLDGVTFTTDANGGFTVYFNPDQFFPGEAGRQFSVADKVSYAFELTFAGEAYRPVVFDMDAVSTDESSRFITRIVNLTAYQSGEVKMPYVCWTENETFKDGTSIGSVEISESESYLGPNSVYTRVDITPVVSLWNKADLVSHDAETGIAKLAENGLTFNYYKANGELVPSQDSRVFVYEFSTFPVAKTLFKADAAAFTDWLDANQFEEVRLEVRDSDRTLWTYTPYYKVINDIATENPKDSGSMEELAREATDSVGKQLDLGTMLGDLIPGGDMLAAGITFFSEVQGGSSPIDLLLIPTADPTAFDVVISIGEEESEDEEDDADGEVKFNFEDKLDFDELEKAVKKKEKEDDQKDKKPNLGEAKFEFDYYGSVVARASYNPDDKSWSLEFREGTIGAAANVEYSYSQTFEVGPVPLFVDFKAGAGINAKINPSMIAGPTGDDKATLATIVVDGFLEAFAGVGVDYSVIALKLGITGRLSLDVTIKTLMGEPGFKHGEKLNLDGMIGLKFAVKILFVEYENTFASASFHTDNSWNAWNEINNYWEGSTVNGQRYAASMQNGNLSMKLMSAPKRMLTAPVQGADLIKSTTLTGNEEPALSDDGSIAVYLNDGKASWAVKYENAYHQRGLIDTSTDADSILGDYYIDVAGTTETGYTAVWVRQTAKMERELNDQTIVSDDELRIAMNSTEIFVATSTDGSAWTVKRLTKNSNPELAPSVAGCDGKAIVAWRSVYNSGTDALAFDVNDDLVYSIYDGSSWSDAKIAYNGASGKIMALDTAITKESAMIAYTVNTPVEGSDIGTETFYTLLKDDTAQTVRATTNTYTDENVKLATVKKGASSQYVLAWYSDNGFNADVNMLGINADGTIDTSFPESVSQMEDLNITSNFELAAAPDGGIDTLIIAWPRFNSKENDKEQYTTIYGAKFYQTADSVGVTPCQKLFETGEYHTVDSFDVYSTGNTANLLLCESDYSGGAAVKVDEINIGELLSHIVKRESFATDEEYQAELARLKASMVDDETKKTIAILASDSKAKLDTVSYPFTEKLEVSADIGSATVIPGLSVPITFTITNSGISPLKNVTIKPAEKNVGTILPGETVVATVAYQVPAYFAQMNYAYTVSTDMATVADVTGTVVLNAPEVGLRKVEVLPQSDPTMRRVNVQLANNGFVDLAGNPDKTVSVEMYKTADRTGTPVASETISDSNALGLIDVGAGVVPFTIDVKDLVGKDGNAYEEIPEDGIPLYALVTVKDGENVIAQSRGNVLIKPMGSEPVTLTHIDEVSSGCCTSTVTITNNTLNPITVENLFVVAYDEKGKALATEYTYKGSAGDSYQIPVPAEDHKQINFALTLPEGTKDEDVARVEVYQTGTKLKYEFRYNLNDGNHTEPYQSGEVNVGEKITQPTSPTIDGQEFLMWCQDAECTEAYDFNTIPVRDTVLYACWKDPVTITDLSAANAVYDGTEKAGYTGTPVCTTAGGEDVTSLCGDLVFTYFAETATAGAYETTGSTDLPTEAGKYKVVISVPEENRDYMGSTELLFTIKQPVKLAEISIRDKVYNGETDDVVIDTYVLIGKNESHTLTVDGVSGTYDSPNVNAAQRITLSDASKWTLGGKDADRYVLADSQPSMAFGKITKADPQFAPAAPEVSGETVTINDADREKKLEYCVDDSKTDNEKAWISVPKLDADGTFTLSGLAKGSHTIYLRVKESNNYYASPSVSKAFELTRYSVAYNANGGVGNIASQTANSGSTVTVKSGSGFSRTGYTFTGWKDENGTSHAVGSTVGTGMTLYAQWEANAYTVRFNANGGSGTMADQSFTYDEAQKLTANTFTRASYTFVGWATSANGPVLYSDEQSVKNLASGGTVTLYAIWAQNVYSIKVNIASPQSGDVQIKLQQGNAVYAVQNNIDMNENGGKHTGYYEFNGVPAGTYNIVVEQSVDGAPNVTMTQLVVLTNNTDLEIALPESGVNSKLEVEEDTLPTVVGGLDEEAETNRQTGKDVTVTMTVEKQEEQQLVASTATEKQKATQDAISEIKATAIGKTLDFMNIELEKETKDSSSGNLIIKEAITETSRVLELVFSYEMNGKKNIQIYRQHGDAVQTFTKLDTKPTTDYKDGTFYVDEANSLIYVYAKQFSTYAIGYEEEQDDPYTPYVPVTPSYSITGADTENGKLTVSRKNASAGSTVTITVAPDEGYKLDTLTVKDAKGNVLTLTKVSDTTYTFKMPGSKVTISATFAEVKAEEPVDEPIETVCPQDETCVYAKFTDADTKAWYHDGVHFCVENGYMQGVSTTAFDPSGTTTRAMIVTMLWRMEGKPVANYAMSFKDVKADQWYTEAIRWAQSTKIVEGYNADSFGPDDPITREQMATILYRFAKNHKINVANANKLVGFTDVNKISTWALDAMKWANAVGLVQGRTTTTLVPEVSITRAEAATMVQRYCEKIVK